MLNKHMAQPDDGLPEVVPVTIEELTEWERRNKTPTPTLWPGIKEFMRDWYSEDRP